MRGILFFSCILVVTSGCASKGVPVNAPAVTLGSCESRTHDIKSNPTADYQTCKYNNGNSELINKCMLEQGWSVMKKMSCGEASSTFAKKDIEYCISKSKIEESLSHDLMNSCLSGFSTQKRESNYQIKRSLSEIMSNFLKLANNSSSKYRIPEKSKLSNSSKQTSLRSIFVTENMTVGDEDFEIIDVKSVSNTRECWLIKRKNGDKVLYEIRTGTKSIVSLLNSRKSCWGESGI